MSSQGQAPLEGIDLVLADLDGVVYRGPHPIEYAVESINSIPSGIRVGYVTNNASRSDKTVAAHLVDMGLNTLPSEVVTSPQAAVALLEGLVPAGSLVLVIGGEGLTVELERRGFIVTRSAQDSPAAIVQGFDPSVGWAHLAEAAFALNGTEGSAIVWVATNTDWTIPQARGIAPGNGTLVSAVHTAVGRLPIVAGKPEVAIFEEAFARFGSRRALMIGDRLDTDILGANRAGILSALVLTGIDQAKQVLAAPENQRPRYLFDDLRDLHRPYPSGDSVTRGEVVTTTVGDARVSRRGHVVTVDGGTGIDLLRAGAAAIWNSGVSIYALEVPAELYS